MQENTDQFYLNQTEPNQSCLLTLRQMILDQDPQVTETRKWGLPCFCYRQKMFCYLWIDKKSNSPYILMVEGKHLNHPALEKGQRARMKTLSIDPNQDIPVSTICNILNEALDLYRQGIIKIK